MRLFLVNFEMDPQSAALAWQYDVACGLAERCERVVVLTEKSVPCKIPANMEVIVVPATYQKFPARWLGLKWSLNYQLLRIFRTYKFDACFVHMAMEWTYRLLPIFCMFRVPVLLWYAHGTVTMRLRIAHWSAQRVVTSTTEGFRIRSDKISVIGQGIDTETYGLRKAPMPRCNVLSVGRISRRKRLHIVVDAMRALRERETGDGIRLILVGKPLTREDQSYELELRRKVVSAGLSDIVVFAGQQSREVIAGLHATAFLHVNVSATGSLDKALLEALACGCPVLTSNEAFFGLLAPHREMLLTNPDSDNIAQRIAYFFSRRRMLPEHTYRDMIIGSHDFESYIEKVLTNIKSIVDNRKGFRRCLSA